AKAAGVPISSASVAEATATMSERTAAWVQICELKIASYHFRLNPSGGQAMRDDSVKETGIMIRTGSSRKASVSATTPQRVTEPTTGMPRPAIAATAL